MKALYTQTSIISKLKKAFYEIFSAESTPTKEHLFDLLLSVLCLNGFYSVNYNFEHFIQYISDNKLKSYYFTLNESKIDLSEWIRNMVRIALSLMPESLQSQLILLSIDDTMVEKYGEHFENREKLFDHARHNGSNYLYGHCFVSIMLSIPVFDQGKIRYLSFPIGYRMWTKEQTKLAMAADMVKEIMEIIGTERNVCLRHDTALYDLPPAKTGKKGRPRVRGKQLSFEDFTFSPVDGTDYAVSSCQVITNLFGKKPVHAIVTKTKNGTQRLFICTKCPDELNFDHLFRVGQSFSFCKSRCTISSTDRLFYALVYRSRLLRAEEVLGFGNLYASRQNRY